MNTPLMLGDLSAYLSDLPKVPLTASAARDRFLEALAAPDFSPPEVSVLWKRTEGALSIEKLSWNLPFGNATEAYLLMPLHHAGRLPAVLALHDHGGQKFFGKQKLVHIEGETPPQILPYQQQYYGGRAWANDLALRGYAVLVHDVFPFESRRLRFSDLPPQVVKNLFEDALPPGLDDTASSIDAYNRCARQMEHLIAKALYAAGLTWSGLTVAEDRIALDILRSNSAVDPGRIGVCGLSLGGLRSIYLSASTGGIAAAVAAGFMTTWGDMIRTHAIDHTWMAFVPGIGRSLDFSGIAALAAPRPLMICNCTNDELFDQNEVAAAEAQLRRRYDEEGEPDHLRFAHYEGTHQFHQDMQEEAFAWLDTHL